MSWSDGCEADDVSSWKRHGGAGRRCGQLCLLATEEISRGGKSGCATLRTPAESHEDRYFWVCLDRDILFVCCLAPGKSGRGANPGSLR
jgi:hypothetical protein